MTHVFPCGGLLSEPKPQTPTMSTLSPEICRALQENPQCNQAIQLAKAAESKISKLSISKVKKLYKAYLGDTVPKEYCNVPEEYRNVPAEHFCFVPFVDPIIYKVHGKQPPIHLYRSMATYLYSFLPSLLRARVKPLLKQEMEKERKEDLAQAEKCLKEKAEEQWCAFVKAKDRLERLKGKKIKKSLKGKKIKKSLKGKKIKKRHLN